MIPKPSTTVSGTFVANSFTGELYPVDKTVIRLTLNKYKLKQENPHMEFYAPQSGFWSKRNQIIYDLLLSGY